MDDLGVKGQINTAVLLVFGHRGTGFVEQNGKANRKTHFKKKSIGVLYVLNVCLMCAVLNVC